MLVTLGGYRVHHVSMPPWHVKDLLLVGWGGVGGIKEQRSKILVEKQL